MVNNEDSVISLRGVAKHFGAVRAVDDVSFEIRRGEFFSLLGPSGCGKTTLLRLLAGFDFPTQGEILIDGQPMSSVPPYKRPTNTVFQSYAIFPHLSVAENIGYGLRKKGLSKRELAESVHQALEQMKLAGYGSRAAHQLSGGHRQRVALARALVCRPKVLLLDEPLGALDRKLREAMQIELRQLQRSVGITFVFVTHDQEEALSLSDRIAVMSKGRVLQIDSAARLYEVPNCRLVADFIGSMNFFDGSIKCVDNGHVIVDVGPAGSLCVPKIQKNVELGAEVTVAVRPEKVHIEWRAPKPKGNAIVGRIADESYLGDRSHYYVEVPGMIRRVCVAHQNAERFRRSIESHGRQVWLTWSTESAVLLPRE
ncbi:MAG: ABC transporter ATP-binding protein [Alphaproteobacteria bacterium]|nr:ABC transporter ATP-binding protein [Alphaproteobacteria bacterium]